MLDSDFAALRSCFAVEDRMLTEAINESQFRFLVENSIAGIFLVRDHRFVYVNPRFAEIHGCTQRDMVGRPLDVYVDPTERLKLRETVELLEKGLAEKRSENVRCRTKLGGELVIGMTLMATSHEGSSAILGMAQDITEKVRAQREVAAYVAKLEASMTATVRTVASMLETRDPYTAGHQRRVASLARAIGKELGLPERQLVGLELAGQIHDLGKIGIPIEILSKPGRLTPLEFALVKTHPEVGYNIMKELELPWPIATVILQHHERMDGSGYPYGCKGADILLESRIVAVADVVEAISSHRPYRASLGIEAALDELEQRQAIYDGEAAQACLRLFRQRGLRLEDLD